MGIKQNLSLALALAIGFVALQPGTGAVSVDDSATPPMVLTGPYRTDDRCTPKSVSIEVRPDPAEGADASRAWVTFIGCGGLAMYHELPITGDRESGWTSGDERLTIGPYGDGRAIAVRIAIDWRVAGDGVMGDMFSPPI